MSLSVTKGAAGGRDPWGSPCGGSDKIKISWEGKAMRRTVFSLGRELSMLGGTHLALRSEGKGELQETPNFRMLILSSGEKKELGARKKRS